MGDVFIKLLNMSLSASWLILAVIVVRLFLKKAPKWCICLLWGLVAIKLVCPFSLESIFSLIPSNEVIPENIALEPHPQIHSGITYVDTVVNPVMEQHFAPNIGDSVNPLQVVVAIAGVVWCIGMVCCLLYSIASFMILKHRVSASKKIREKVYACDEVKSPFILGIFRPVIYVPSGMSDEVLEYVIAHENAHLKRGDHFWKPLGFLILSVYWFNPMCWAAYMLLCRDIEYACDEKVIRDKDDEYAVSYSQALLDCNVQRRIIAACPLAFGETGVKSRVKGILNYKKPAFWVIIVTVIVCIVVAVCFLTNPTRTDDVADITDDFGLTLPGADEIYPTILVDGECYQWRMGRAVMNEDIANHSTSDPNEFLKDMELYGEIIKGSGNHPEQDRELVCVFDASGTIYLDTNDENVVYLWLTTDWFEDGVIAFDRVNNPGYVSLNAADVIIPSSVDKMIIINSQKYSASYTDEKKISYFIKYLNTICVSPETVLEENYYKPVVPAVLEGDLYLNHLWRVRIETKDGCYEMAFFDNSGFDDIYNQYELPFKDMTSASPYLAYVEVESPPANPVVRWWSIPQEQYDGFILLLKSVVPDKVAPEGMGFEEWRE